MSAAAKLGGDLRNLHPAPGQDLRFARLGRRQLRASATAVSSLPRRHQASHDAFPDERPFELRKGTQHAQEELALTGGRVHLGANPFQDGLNIEKLSYGAS